MALFAALVGHGHLIAGFTNRVLRERVAVLLDHAYSSRQGTYDLRRLKRKGLIRRLPGGQCHELTPLGRQIAVLFIKTYCRVLTPGLIALGPDLPIELANRSPLAFAGLELDLIVEHQAGQPDHTQILTGAPASHSSEADPCSARP